MHTQKKMPEFRKKLYQNFRIPILIADATFKC